MTNDSMVAVHDGSRLSRFMRDPRVRGWGIALSLLLIFTMLVPEPAYAQSSGANLEGIAQKILDIVTGPVAKILAILAVVFVGFLFFTGRGNVLALVTVIIGIAIVFSANFIVTTIIG